MKREAFVDELQEAITSRIALRPIVTILRKFHDLGISRDEVRNALVAMRDRAPDEATEDRILEVIDIVVGFCSRENSVWGV